MAILNFVYDKTESILFSGPKIWDVLPNDVRVKETEEAFKGAEKNEKQNISSCRFISAI